MHCPVLSLAGREQSLMKVAARSFGCGMCVGGGGTRVCVCVGEIWILGFPSRNDQQETGLCQTLERTQNERKQRVLTPTARRGGAEEGRGKAAKESKERKRSFYFCGCILQVCHLGLSRLWSNLYLLEPVGSWEIEHSIVKRVPNTLKQTFWRAACLEKGKTWLPISSASASLGNISKGSMRVEGH